MYFVTIIIYAIIIPILITDMLQRGAQLMHYAGRLQMTLDVLSGAAQHTQSGQLIETLDTYIMGF